MFFGCFFLFLSLLFSLLSVCNFLLISFKLRKIIWVFMSISELDKTFRFSSLNISNETKKG
jgi:hypothetical protein